MAIAGVAATAVLVHHMHSQLAEPASPPPVPPPPKPARSVVAASGLVEACRENTSMGVPAAGMVAKVHVQVWDHVRTGSPLLTLDDRDIRAQLISQQAEVLVAAAQLERLQEQLRRLQSIGDPRAVSQDELETRHSDVAVATAQLAAARASVAQSEAMIERLVVRAPIDGTILQVNVRRGEYVLPGPATASIVLGNIDQLQLRADVDEQLAPRVRAGLNAVGYLKGDSSNPIHMTFVRIEPFVVPKISLTGAATERSDTRVLQVIFSFANPRPAPVYVGQQMDIYIEN